MKCDSTDFMFPMRADIYYPLVDQSAYGQLDKTWMIDRTVAGSFVPAGSNTKENVVVSSTANNYAIMQNIILTCRVRCDLRTSTIDDANVLTNILVTNIRDASNNEIYIETGGPRSGKSTLFEIASHEPFIGAFGSIEYYRLVLRRSENQASNV